MDFLSEFKKIKNELEEVYTAEEWNKGDYYDINIKYIIHCEYGHHDKPTIHYNLMYGGNDEFNELLDKYGLLMEWINPCLVELYSAEGVKKEFEVFHTPILEKTNKFAIYTIPLKS